MFPATVLDPEPEPPKTKFLVVGMFTSPEFQLCRCYTERLHKSFPKEYAKPEFRPRLDVEWNSFITKVRRQTGGEKLWALQKPVAVFMNDEFLGDNKDLLAFIAKKYRLTIMKDFEQIGVERLAEHISKQTELGNNFVYFTIAIEDRIIGSLLFQIYIDMVPLISEIFIRRCLKTRGGYAGTPIQRIALPSWIQCGGWNLRHHHVPCENYIFRHDRRGVLSMCHNGKHNDNSTQFFITLDPTPWMDYKYVAFGRLIQGDEVLKIIERIPTRYEAPLRRIEIVKCGELSFCPRPDPKTAKELEQFLAKKDAVTSLHEDVLDPRATDSLLHRRRYTKGLYCAKTDMQSYMPFLHLPDYLIYKHFLLAKEEPEPEEEGCTCYPECRCNEQKSDSEKSRQFGEELAQPLNVVNM